MINERGVKIMKNSWVMAQFVPTNPTTLVTATPCKARGRLQLSSGPEACTTRKVEAMMV